MKVKQILAALALCVLTALGSTLPAIAGTQQSNSTNYGVSEVNFGSGGELHACSTTYCAKQSAGELTVGETNSTNYRARAGANTFREEFLTMIVSSGGINLGVLDATTVKYGSSSFSVRAFPAQGYSVYVNGYTPKNKTGHSITAMSTAGTSTPGTAEQFGINLMANGSPAIGADPTYVPNGTFAFGVAATGYNTPDTFKFVPGDLIATSPKGYGETNFTLSAIINITPNTPSGNYAGVLDVIAVPTF